jgi:hypothetical protein
VRETTTTQKTTVIVTYSLEWVLLKKSECGNNISNKREAPIAQPHKNHCYGSSTVAKPSATNSQPIPETKTHFIAPATFNHSALSTLSTIASEDKQAPSFESR